MTVRTTSAARHKSINKVQLHVITLLSLLLCKNNLLLRPYIVQSRVQMPKRTQECKYDYGRSFKWRNVYAARNVAEKYCCPAVLFGGTVPFGVREYS